MPVSAPQAKFRELAGTSGYCGFCGGRGAGKSVIGAQHVIATARPGAHYLAVSPSIPMLKDGVLPAFQEVCRALGIRQRVNKTDHRGWFQTPAGGKAFITMRSGDNPDALRGGNYSGVWLDEASIMKSEVEPIVVATLREGREVGYLIATFTPKGRRHWTYKTFAQTPGNDLVISHTGENPFVPREFAPMLLKRYTRQRARQEFYGEFIDPENQLISYEDMTACVADCLWPDGRPPRQLTRMRPVYYMGWDLGRTRDKSVIWTWEKLADVLWCREIFVMDNKKYAYQKAEARRRIRELRPVRMLIDKGTIGNQMAEEMEDEFPGVCCGVQMTDGIMAAMGNALAVDFQRRRVRVPADQVLFDDVANVPTPVIRQGRDSMPTSLRDETGHADRFWAAALGHEAAARTPAYRRRRAIGAS